MGHLRLVHSLNTRPLSIDCYGVDALRRLAGNVWYFSLSVAYAKAAGAEIVLHADSLGAALLGHLPYDRVSLTLDGMPRGIHPRFWAAGKIWALRAEGPGAVHIDGDVFVKSRGLARELASGEWDVLAQDYESSEWYEDTARLFDGERALCEEAGLRVHEHGAWNTGVLGIRDPGLLERFADNYAAIALRLSGSARDILDRDNYITPDLILEQRHIYQLARERGARVKLLLPDKSRIQADARAMGYQHVLTSAKFGCLDKCRAVLKKISPEIHRKTEMLCRNILEE